MENPEETTQLIEALHWFNGGQAILHHSNPPACNFDSHKNSTGILYNTCIEQTLHNHYQNQRTPCT